MRSRKKMLKAIPTLNSQHFYTHLPFIKITLLHSRRMTARTPPHLLSSQLSHLKQQVNPKMKRLPLRLNNRTNPRRSTILTQPTQSPTLHYVSHKNSFLNDQRSYPKSPTPWPSLRLATSVYHFDLLNLTAFGISDLISQAQDSTVMEFNFSLRLLERKIKTTPLTQFTLVVNGRDYTLVSQNQYISDLLAEQLPNHYCPSKCVRPSSRLEETFDSLYDPQDCGGLIPGFS